MVSSVPSWTGCNGPIKTHVSVGLSSLSQNRRHTDSLVSLHLQKDVNQSSSPASSRARPACQFHKQQHLDCLSTCAFSSDFLTTPYIHSMTKDLPSHQNYFQYFHEKNRVATPNKCKDEKFFLCLTLLSSHLVKKNNKMPKFKRKEGEDNVNTV